MKVCIIGDNLVSLTLAKALVNRGIFVEVINSNKKKNYNKNRTLGISKSNVDYFNNNIINIEKILWPVNKIEIFTENFLNKKILNFSNDNKNLFSILQNYKLLLILEKQLKKNKLFKYKKSLSLKEIGKDNYNLFINCDLQHEITKKLFSKQIVKKYKSIAYTTIVEHEKIIDNNVASQIFTNLGPIAFLPISNVKTSIVCSLRIEGVKDKININKIIERFNPKYKIISIEKSNQFILTSSSLRRYYKDNILAFGDLLHKLHPLAGQGFNMSIRDIRNLINLIDKKISLGLDIDNSICIDFQNKTKDKNYIFSTGIDLIYELFNFESKVKSRFLNKLINFIGNKKLTNDIFKKFADHGLNI